MRAVQRVILVVSIVLLGGLVSGPAWADDGNTSLPDCPRLAEGDVSDCVATLQWDLDQINPGYNLRQDREFGPATRVAVLDFQGRHVPGGADGIVGPDTAFAIHQALSDPVQPPAPVPPECTRFTDAAVQGQCVMAVWCNTQDLGYEHGQCVPLDPGAALPAGKTPLDCAEELAGGKANELITKDRAAEALASEAAKLAAERLAAGVTLAESTKCLFWDVPEG